MWDNNQQPSSEASEGGSNSDQVTDRNEWKLSFQGLWCVIHRNSTQFVQDEQNHRQRRPVQVSSQAIPTYLSCQWLVPEFWVLASSGGDPVLSKPMHAHRRNSFLFLSLSTNLKPVSWTKTAFLPLPEFYLLQLEKLLFFRQYWIL